MTRLYKDIDKLNGLDSKISSLKTSLNGLSKTTFSPPCSFSGQSVLNRVFNVCKDAADDCDFLIDWLKDSVRYYGDYEKNTESEIKSFEAPSILEESTEVIKLG